ncbi:VOC family protein [Xanthobacter sp. V3C-3]|uniref:VOC family protein n=1 Tax=Xanthobacter lutulentifluminis TaxID=3119935 RepID=UPI0037297475
MISHVNVGTNDIAAARRFYDPLMARLGWRLRFSNSAGGRAGWEPASGGWPLFLLGRPHDGGRATSGNGAMVAFLAPDRATVDDIHRMAITAGGADEGPPGLRPHYHPNYYGAYFRDLDGNKICVCCHAAQEA